MCGVAHRTCRRRKSALAGFGSLYCGVCVCVAKRDRTPTRSVVGRKKEKKNRKKAGYVVERDRSIKKKSWRSETSSAVGQRRDAILLLSNFRNTDDYYDGQEETLQGGRRRRIAPDSKHPRDVFVSVFLLFVAERHTRRASGGRRQCTVCVSDENSTLLSTAVCGTVCPPSVLRRVLWWFQFSQQGKYRSHVAFAGDPFVGPGFCRPFLTSLRRVCDGLELRA